MGWGCVCGHRDHPSGSNSPAVVCLYILRPIPARIYRRAPVMVLGPPRRGRSALPVGVPCRFGGHRIRQRVLRVPPAHLRPHPGIGLAPEETQIAGHRRGGARRGRREVHRDGDAAAADPCGEVVQPKHSCSLAARTGASSDLGLDIHAVRRRRGHLQPLRHQLRRTTRPPARATVASALGRGPGPRRRALREGGDLRPEPFVQTLGEAGRGHVGPGLTEFPAGQREATPQGEVSSSGPRAGNLLARTVLTASMAAACRPHRCRGEFDRAETPDTAAGQ